MNLGKRCIAECFGTFWLVFGGCGSAVLAAVFAAQVGTTPISLGIGFVGVSLAFGLTVLTMAYTIGHISGCHLNPAVTLGLTAGGRFKAADVGPYIVSQVIGGVLGAAVLYVIESGNADFNLSGGFASNGFEDHSPFFFLFIIHGATDKRAPAGFAPIAIGLGLTLIHLIGIPVTNLSVNPARSTGPALFVGGWAISQLWLFWVAPIIGAVAAGLFYKTVFESDK